MSRKPSKKELEYSSFKTWKENKKRDTKGRSFATTFTKDTLLDYKKKKKRQAESSKDPTDCALRVLLRAMELGDEIPGDNPRRPTDGIRGMDQSLSTEYRYLESRDTDYYQFVCPFNYSEFCRMGPQLVDKFGIMYRFADARLSDELGLWKGNRLLREDIEPVGRSIMEGFEASGLSSSHVLMWFAKPKGKPFEVPPRSNKAGEEAIEFLDPRTRVSFYRGRVAQQNVFQEPGFAVGYLYVRTLKS